MSNSKLPTITVADIRGWKPCFDPTEYVAEDWQGTALDVLRVNECPAEDRLWVVLRDQCIDARTLRLFAVLCARRALAQLDNPDPRSVTACDVAERYANGEATAKELEAAWYTACDAARAAAWDTAWDAAWAAACDAARAAAWAAAWDAAWDAAWAAAWAAASAARDAASAARDAARAAEYTAQVKHLIEMLEVEYDQA